MRSLISVLLVAILCLGSVAAHAKPADAGCGPDEKKIAKTNGQIVCIAILDDVDGGATGGGGGGPPSEDPVGVWRSWPVMSSWPDGTPCTSRDGAYLDPDSDAHIINTIGYWNAHDTLARGGQEPQDCPWVSTSGRPPVTSHVADSVALPTPETNPSRGLVGKATYLITNGSTVYPRTTFSATVAGFAVTWEVEATGAFFVDWGDGTPETGPYHTPGARWPDGEITHDYTTRGTYTISVREQWTVRYRRTSPAPQEAWSTFTMQTGPFQIPAFEVIELQPVRER